MIVNLTVVNVAVPPDWPGADIARAPASDVMMMSLNEPDSQALGCIEDGLACSDPRLASMLNIFSRLAAGEEVPAGERIRCGAGRRQPTVRAMPSGGRAGAQPSRKRAACTSAWAGSKPCWCCGPSSPPQCLPSRWPSTPSGHKLASSR